MGKVRIGIYGTGLAAFLQHRSFAKSDRAEVTAVCGHTQARLDEFAAERGIAYCTTDYARFLEEAPADAVCICTPDHLHGQHAIAALEAGKHVLCEKPMCTTVADARAMIEAVDKAGKVFLVGQVVRFSRNARKIHELCAAGELGDLFFVEGDYLHNIAHLIGGTWRDDAANPQGPFLGGGCHPLDFLRWIAGDVAEIHAYSNHIAMPSFPLDDCFIAAMRFRSGCIGKVMVSIACRRPYELNMAAYGTRGTIVRDRVYMGEPEEGRDFEPLGVPRVRETDTDFFDEEIAHFVSCVLDGEKPLIDVRDGARTVAACIAAEKSLDSGQPEAAAHEF